VHADTRVFEARNATVVVRSNDDVDGYNPRSS
jgi:hypothetical protein